MKIQKLTLEGFRGFKDKTDFELHPNVNVFVGVNGSGKTSVLDAVGMLLSRFILQVVKPKSNDNFLYLSETDINEEEGLNRIIFTFKDSHSKNHVNSINISLREGIEISHHLSPYWNDLHVELDRDWNYPIPMIRYYRINQIVNSREQEQSFINRKDFISNRTNTYYKTAFNLNTDFNTFANWYINEENDENRVKVETKDLEYNNPKLAPVREAINLFFNKIDASSLSNLIGDVGVANGKLSPLAIKKNGIRLNINQLSSGEKQVILYVADIASRLSIANPRLENTNEGEGVVLIDEIDTHLHPAWQRDIIPALTHVFPNVQFLVTTHSPQVLSNVKKECVHIIENFKRVPLTPSTFGADSNMILWDVFGVKKRPKHLQERLSEYYRALEKKSKDEVLKILERIEEDYGSDRIDIKKARMDFQFEYDEYLPKA